LAASCLLGQAYQPNVQPELLRGPHHASKCQIVGVNSVTNIELDKGVMPAPIIRNADWFEKIAPYHMSGRFLLPDRRCWQPPERAFYADTIIYPLIQDSGKWPIY
jgi:hypothetical protein